MKTQVKYKSISIEGFQSFGKRQSFNLNRIGLNLIVGANGLGKSTLFNALLWAEYGVNLKKSVETWAERRHEDYKGTRVVVDRTDGVYDYRIARHLKFKGTTLGLSGGDKLMIFKKSVNEPAFTQEHLVGEGLHKSDMQKLIEEQLGIDSTTYLNSIFFGQRMKSLIEVPNADKRKLFEELFNLDFIEEAKDRAKEKYSELSSQVDKLKLDLSSAETRKRETEATLENFRGVLATFEANKKARIQELNEEVGSLKEEVKIKTSAIKKAEEKLSTYNFEVLEEANNDVNEIEGELFRQNQKHQENLLRVKKIANEKQTASDNIKKHQKAILAVEHTCPYCKSPLNKEEIEKTEKEILHKISLEEEVLKILDKDAEKIELLAQGSKNLADELSAKLAKAREYRAEVQRGLDEAFVLKNTIVSDKKALDVTLDRIEVLYARIQKEEASEPPKVDIKKYEGIITECEAILANNASEIETKQVRLDKIDWWVKKGFGSGGMKSFIFNAMLNQLNIYAQNYASRLGFRVEFSVDMSKASKPFQTLIYQGDLVRDYEDLSGGQKRRVDICVAFAMHDVISHKLNANILVMDEFFENLDNEGLESAFDLLRQKAGDKAIYLITHSDIIDSLNAHTINISSDELGNTFIGK